MIDRTDNAIEHGRQTGAGVGDQCAITLNDAPVDVGAVVTVEVDRRNPIPLGAGDVGAERIDQAVPARVRIEISRGGDIGLPVAHALQPREERTDRLLKLILLRVREADFR